MPSELLRSRVRRFGIALLCAKVALVPLVFDAASDQSFTVPKALLSHALAGALLAVMFGLLVRFGRTFLVWSRVHIAVLAFLAVSVLATVVAPDPRLALFGNHGRMLGLGSITDWVILYFAFVHLVRTRGESLVVLGAVILPTPFVIAYEFIQGAGRDPLSWTTGNAERPFSTFGLSTALGEYLVIVAAGLSVIAVLLDGPRRGQRLLLLWWAGILLLGAIRSGTRSIVIGAVLAFVVVGVVLWVGRASRRQRAMLLGATAVGVVAIAVVLFATPLGERVTTTFVAGQGGNVQVDPSTSGRLDLYRIAYGMVLERPLLGYGPDSFAAGVAAHRPDPADVLVRQSLATSGHGWIPYVATGSGLVGLAIFLALLGVAGYALVHRSGDTLALCGGAMAAAFLGAGLTSVDDVSVDWLFWLGLALVAAVPIAPVSAPARPPSKGSRRKHSEPVARGPRYAGAIGAAIGVAALLVVVPAWGASRAAKTSQDTRLVGKVREGIDAGVAAVQADPGRAEYWHALGFAYIGAQRYRDASSALAHAVELAPYDILHISDQVQAELALAQSGDQAAIGRALALSDRAVRLDPNNPRAQLLRATTLQASGDRVAAEPFIRRALALDPGSANEVLYVTAVQVLTANGHADEAITIARASLGYLPGTAVGLRFELARALVTVGKLSEALTELDYILAVNPNLTAAQQLRAQVRGQLP